LSDDTAVFFLHVELDHTSGLPAAWLVSREGKNMTYWGGAARNSYRQCANGTCNCDINDDVWREDSGFLSYKEDLPVTALR